MKTIKLMAIAIIMSVSAVAATTMGSTREATNSNHDLQSEWTSTKKSKCTRCDGTGQIAIHKKCTCSYGSNPGCEKCNYTGTITTYHRCPSCNGSGEIVTTTTH